MSDSEINNTPVKVTDEERSHIAFHLLARACITLARHRQETNAEVELGGEPPLPAVAEVQEAEHA